MLLLDRTLPALSISLFFVSAVLGTARAQQSASWTVADPFRHNVFIKNEGQLSEAGFSAATNALYSARIGHGVSVFFYKDGLSYFYDEVEKKEEDEEEEREREREGKGERKEAPKHKFHTVALKWAGASQHSEVVASDAVPFYFTYAGNEKVKGYKASAFRKLVYKNVYPGIDAEFFFTEKSDLKYNFVVHAGADPSVIEVALKNERVVLNEKGELSYGDKYCRIKEGAPVAYYAESSAATVDASFKRTGSSSFGFTISAYDNTKDLVIDPYVWVQTPQFTAFSGAYDVDYDFAGNTYVYGGDYPYELMKYDQWGNLQWIHVTSVFSPWTYYGDFAVNPNNGDCYVIECWNYASKILRLNTNGQPTNLFGGNNNLQEIYRVVFNNCTKQLILAGGAFGTNAGIIDTSLSNLTLVNVLNTNEIGHDMCLLAQDNDGNCFMATSEMGLNFDNVMLKCPVSSLSPAAWLVSDNHNFQESGSVTYISNSQTRAGYNGMAATRQWVYTYDGQLLQRWNKNTGALSKTRVFPSTAFTFGGIAADDCGNLFIGHGSTVMQLDTALNTMGYVYYATGNIFDIRLHDNALYVCGLGFVGKRAVSINYCNPLQATATSLPCLTTGSATVTVQGLYPPYTFNWSPGTNTSSLATGLATGNYTVYVKDAACIPNFTQAEVFIANDNTASLIAPDTVCAGSQVLLKATGGLTYQWSTGDTASQIYVAPLQTTTYSVIASVGPFCHDTAEKTVSVLPWPQPAITSIDTICAGNPIALVASGGGTYSWNTGETTQQITVEPEQTTLYYVFVSNGYCTDSASKYIVIKDSPEAVAVLQSYNQLNGQLHAEGGVNYQWYPSEGLSCDTCPDPTVELLESKEYCVSVSDNLGCADTACLNLAVTIVYVPNAFTPTGDRLNECFKPVISKVSDYRFAVFNRWGEKLFETTDTEKGWDGRYMGRVCPQDTYVYRLWYIDNQFKEEHSQAGRVTLLKAE